MKDCGACTLCCKLLPIDWMQSEAGGECSACDVGIGCTIFYAADARCRSFECMYRQVECHADLRPDRCGVVFEKMSAHLLYGSIDPDIGFTDAAKRQVSAFNREGFSVVLDDMRRKKLIVAPRTGMHSAEVMEDFVAKRDAKVGAVP